MVDHIEVKFTVSCQGFFIFRGRRTGDIPCSSQAKAFGESQIPKWERSFWKWSVSLVRELGLGTSFEHVTDTITDMELGLLLTWDWDRY